MLKMLKIAVLTTAIVGGMGVAHAVNESLPVIAHAPKNINYSLKIVNPAIDQAYQRPAQSVDIAIEVSPKLDLLDTLVIQINGMPVAYNQKSYSFASTDYNPGEVKLRVEVQNEAGQAVASDERTVYLIQNTPLIRQQRELEANKQAYDALPWYKKIITKKPTQTTSVPVVPIVQGVPTAPNK